MHWPFGPCLGRLERPCRCDTPWVARTSQQNQWPVAPDVDPDGGHGRGNATTPRTLIRGMAAFARGPTAVAVTLRGWVVGGVEDDSNRA